MPVAYSSLPAAPVETRPLWLAMGRGFTKHCPRCGKGKAFGKYLKVTPVCPVCGLELHHQRADDAPPYFTAVIVGHVVVPGLLIMEQRFDPPNWMQYALWLPVALLLTLWLLPRVKGALIGFQWARGMHGFGAEPPVVFDAAET